MSSRLPSPVLNNDDPALFPKMTDAQMEWLARYGKVRPVQVGDILFREGDATYGVTVLLEGSVAVVVVSGDAMRDLAVQEPRDLMVEFNILTERACRCQGRGCGRRAHCLQCRGRIRRPYRPRTDSRRLRVADVVPAAQGDRATPVGHPDHKRVHRGDGRRASGGEGRELHPEAPTDSTICEH
jgi:hypothetical protein